MLVGGRRLTWCVIDHPDRQPPWIPWHKLDRRPIHHTVGRRLLGDADHEDVPLRDTTVAAAMLDRLLHRSVALNLDGDSYRLRDHHARTDTLRRTTTGTRNPLR